MKALECSHFSDAQGQITLESVVVSSRTWNSSKLQHVLVTHKNEDDSYKNEEARVVTTISHYKSMGIFQDAQGQLTPQT